MVSIERLKNNIDFYNGFEDEPEIEIFSPENSEFNIHIWVGYFHDIFGEPALDGKGWNGFTRDCNQLERTYDEKDVKIDIDEYLNDLYIYKERTFRFEETRDCYELLCAFLEHAKQEGNTVKVNWW